jgi:hypothetical protein
MKNVIRISEEYKDVTCENCGWSWDIEPDDKHPYLCHQCGHENTKHETDEGAGPYDAPAFQMKPDHVHFKHQYNEQNDNKGYLLQMGRKSILVEQYGDEAELFKLASAYYRKNGKVMTIKVLEKILHTLSKRDEPHRAKSQEFPPSLHLQEQVVQGKTGDPYEYKKEGGYYFARKKGSNKWILTRGSIANAISKKFNQKNTVIQQKDSLGNRKKSVVPNDSIQVSDTLINKNIIFNPKKETYPMKCGDKGCARWVSDQLEGLGLQRQGNAWHSHNIDGGNIKYTPFKNLNDKLLQDMSNLFTKINANPTEKSQEGDAKKIIQQLIPNQSSLKNILKVNDVVGLYWDTSDNFTRAFFEGATGNVDMGKGIKVTNGPYFRDEKGKPWAPSDLGKKIKFVPGNSLKKGLGFGLNTHLGYVGAVVDGEPIIFHNVHGTVFSTPLNDMDKTKIVWVKKGPSGEVITKGNYNPDWWEKFLDFTGLS